MNKTTKNEVERLKKLTEAERIVLLRGGNGVGKTYLAKKIAKKICEPDDCWKVISLHKGFEHTDFVEGTNVKPNTGSNGLEFVREDKVLKSILAEADKNHTTKYALILDDIQRTNVYSLFGDELDKILETNRSNFFLIATMNTSVMPDERFDYSMFSKFCTVEIESDYEYIRPDTKPFYDYNEFIYIKTNAIVRNYLNYAHFNWRQQFNRYKIGHGYFIDHLPVRIRYQIVPLLREYMKDGVLVDHDASLENELYSLHYESYDSIQLVSNMSQQNIINLNCNQFGRAANAKRLHEHIEKLREKNLLCDDDFFSGILTSEKVFKRVSGNPNTPFSGSLFVNQFRNDKLYRLTTTEKQAIRGVPYYSNKMHIKYRGTKYYYSTNAHNNEKNSDMIQIPKTIEECTNELNYNNIWAPLLYEYIGRWLYLINSFGAPIEIKYIQPIISDFRNAKTLKNLEDCLTRITSDTNLNKGVVRRMSNQNILTIMENTGIHQVILQGPPGTSKTYTAKMELEKQLEDINNNNGSNIKFEDLQVKDFKSIESSQFEHINKTKMCWCIVQFHPIYSYEDFVRGINVTTYNGQPQYDTINKTLGKIARFASDNEEIKCYLIIDEINRANVANVFGELIYALEYRGENVSTPYSIKDEANRQEDTDIKIPSNVYIIGTMNTADKSIGTLDYAIRRRFIFYPCLPEKAIIENYYKNMIDVKSIATKLFDAVEALFEVEKGYLSFDYNANDVQVGHTYFLAEGEKVEDVKEKLYSKFEYQVLPLLKEYYKDGVLEYDTADGKNEGAKLIMEYLGGSNKANALIKKIEELAGGE